MHIGVHKTSYIKGVNEHAKDNINCDSCCGIACIELYHNKYPEGRRILNSLCAECADRLSKNISELIKYTLNED